MKYRAREIIEAVQVLDIGDGPALFSEYPDWLREAIKSGQVKPEIIGDGRGIVFRVRRHPPDEINAIAELAYVTYYIVLRTIGSARWLEVMRYGDFEEKYELVADSYLPGVRRVVLPESGERESVIT